MAADQAASLSTLAAALQTAGSAAATTLTTQVPALLQTAVGQLSASNVTGAVNTLLQIPLAIAAPALGLLRPRTWAVRSYSSPGGLRSS